MSTLNVNPKTIFTGDNLPILRGINSESIDLIYLDPPFNSKANYAAPMGSPAAGASFKDMWTLNDIDITWLDLIQIEHPQLNRVIHAAMTDSDKSYLIYIAIRLLEMHRILKPTGNIYLHCDPTMSHYVKLLMDAIFGRNSSGKSKGFQNEIIWCYGGRGMSKTRFNRKHDTILFYRKSSSAFFSSERASRPIAKEHIGRYNKTDDQGRKYARVKNRDGTYSNIYLSNVVLEDWWQIPYVRGSEYTGFPTQKPLKLLERIIKASSNEGDIVLDPFCGCATTCVAADRLQRNWIGIDEDEKSPKLVVDRIKDDQGLFEDIIHRTDIPKRTDLGHIPKYNAPENKAKLYKKQEGHCNGCGDHFKLRNLEVDHIIATSVGGTDHIDNLQLLCNYCNRVKGDRGQEYLLSRLNPEHKNYILKWNPK